MKKIFLVLTIFTRILVANDVDEGLQAYSEKDFKKARILWDKSCKQGNMSSCNYLADLYRVGKGVDYQSYLMAVELYQKSCNENSPKG